MTVPQPLVQPAAPNNVTYYFADLFTGDILAEPQLESVNFTLALNNTGPFTATLSVEDPSVLPASYLTATAPNKTAIWIDINGALVYGGIVQTRRYSRRQQTVTLAGNDHWTYFTQRVQAADYSTNWATSGAGATEIAEQILTDILAVGNSMPIDLSTVLPAGGTPAQFQINATYPESQEQTGSSLITQLQQLGFEVGFDFAVDVAYVAGVPTSTITLSYPRRGRVAGTTGLVVDVTDAIDFEYDEDGTQQATTVYELATAAGGLGAVRPWAPATGQDGYPVLERVMSHMAISSTTSSTTDLDGTPALLSALAQGDLALYAYPVTVPAVTIPLFGSPAIGDYIVGDDIQLIVPTNAGTGLPPIDPRFPDGLDWYFRIVQADITIGDVGKSTAKLTLSLPPSTTPQEPPPN